ncbi:TMEM165/GDT1 family protein [Sneathiella sp.]|uniref:TMEM165/GDT1 family protein n=1 Tax=Sneathiella sp. TaxID=1964365 RepID=UPI002637B587|nr:TMEM165/GDT1 family protein [Sneathiella sp.]MDF2368238.1 TMEM165/GDT1 family protein [Sneathiella sp.]
MEAFFTSVLTVALAEIGDKTQLLSLFLIARFNKPWSIIAGILIATLLNHAASAWAGVWLGQFLESTAGVWVIGGSFIVVGLWLLIPDKEGEPTSRWDTYGAFLVSLILFFLAEIGDKTQIATVLLGANFGSLVLVTLGTTLGMLVANVPVIFFGAALMRHIPLRAARTAAAVVFVATGLYSLVTGLA